MVYVNIYSCRLESLVQYEKSVHNVAFLYNSGLGFHDLYDHLKKFCIRKLNRTANIAFKQIFL
jgi:hypothetical protein